MLRITLCHQNYAFAKTTTKKVKDNKKNTILITPHYKSYQERNNNVTEKVVAI